MRASLPSPSSGTARRDFTIDAEIREVAEERPSWSRVASLAKSRPRVCSYETWQCTQKRKGAGTNAAVAPSPDSFPNGSTTTRIGTRGRYDFLTTVTPCASDSSHDSGSRRSSTAVCGSAGHS